LGVGDLGRDRLSNALSPASDGASPYRKDFALP
jgi:hypothetical protein